MDGAAFHPWHLVGAAFHLYLTVCLVRHALAAGRAALGWGSAAIGMVVVLGLIYYVTVWAAFPWEAVAGEPW